MIVVMEFAFVACMAALAALLWWQHRTILGLAADAEAWRELREHVRTAGVVCWWQDGEVRYQEAPKTAGEFRERARLDAPRPGVVGEE